MNNKSKKIYISVIIIISILCSFDITSFAQDPFSGLAIGGFGGVSGAGLFGSMAGMSGVNIDYDSDPVNDALWNKLNSDSVYFNGEKHEATNQGEDIYDYITVNIGDWLDAQHDFITEYISQNNVEDNETGSVPVAKSYAGYSFYNQVGQKTYGSQIGMTGQSFTIGEYHWQYEVGQNYDSVKVYKNSVLVNSGQVGKNLDAPVYLSIDGYNNIEAMYLKYGAYFQYGGPGNSVITQPPSNVNWQSGTVDDTIFNDWTEAKVKIPHTESGLTSNWTLEEFFQAINNLWSTGNENLIEIENNESPPPPPPIPDTPLGEVPMDEWVDYWGQSVITNQENGNESLDNIDTNIQTGVDTLDSIDTNIGTTNGILGQIKDLIQSGINSITNLLNQILSAVQTLVQSIVNATETLIAGILNQIPIAFQSAWNTIKQHVSIWHYVVEWITSISSVLTWVWTMASGTSYYIILPVYASLAGAVVLALYKKFGR